jgi:methyl-accepting chemotaxis protein
MKFHHRLIHQFEHCGIGTRLKLGFGLVLLLTALLGATAYASLTTVKTAARELADSWLPGLAHMGSARVAVLEIRDFEIKHSRALDAGYMDEYEEKMKTAATSLATSIKAFKDVGLDAEEAKLFAAYEKAWGEYDVSHRKVLELGRAGKQDDAKDIGDGAAKMAADEVIASIDRLSAYEYAQGEAAGERANAIYQRARFGILAFVATALVIGLVMAFAITRGLIRQLGGEPRTAAELARAVATGDLTTTVPVRPGDTVSLMAALRDMQISLTRVVATVRQGSEGVAMASGEIAQGNNDLSGRTEQQASALQETAASMEQLGSTVHRNADNARQADQLARAASEVAAKGGEAVSQVVDTMKGINESARQIGDITGVIDSIAFQTNILALNAAVEAARAGEQGRGFAVVAAEVRSLAQRSAEAAKQIKLLIAASMDRVEQGGVHVDRAGETMHEVVTAIQRVTQMVSEISSASIEQSAGVRQVGEAVSQMDQTTQQNAALVEESAAAAESLKQQAEQLVQAVAVFRLEASHS